MCVRIFTTSVRYTLVTVNLIFLISGIVILSVGSSVQDAYNRYHEFLSERFFSLPAFCIATGVIIFIIAFFGFLGAFKENYVIIKAYTWSMLVMFVFLLSACIAGYALRGRTVALVQQQLVNTMELYGPDNLVVTKLWDEVQSDFTCCGVKNATDWLEHLKSKEGLPISCCSFPVGSVNSFNCTIHSPTVFTTGCLDEFGSWVQSHVGAIGIAGLILVIMQALTVAGALWLAKMSKEKRGSFP